MTPRNKVTAVEVQMSIDLAREIFRESGNLAISEFPATLEFAESLAEAINLDEDETEPRQWSLVVEQKEPISVYVKRKK